MGHLRDHAIVISSRNEEEIKLARLRAIGLFGAARVAQILGPFMNGSLSFFIAPDGSKEYWETSNENDEWRHQFKEYLRKEQIRVNWVEVQFADDDCESRIVDHSDADRENGV